MLALLETVPAALLSLLASLGIVYTLVTIWETAIKPDKLQLIGDKLLNSSFRSGARRILEFYLTRNNRLFGRAIISWRSFGVSIVLTCLWASSLILIYCFYSASYREWMINIVTVPNLRQPALAAFLSVLLIDYASICMTRKIFRTTLTRGKRTFTWAIILDVLASVIIYYIGLSICKLIFMRSALLSPMTSIETWLNSQNIATVFKVLEDFDISKGHKTSDGKFVFDTPLSTEVVYAFPEGVFFFTSLLTSVWLWLYIAAYAIAYVATRIDRFKPLLLDNLNFQQKPLSALTAIISTLLVAIVLIKASIKTMLN